MLTSNFLIMFISLLQPLFLVIIIFISCFSGGSSTILEYFTNTKKLKNTKYFECATYSQKTIYLRYDIQVLSLATMFIIYDVDLLFFISEVFLIQS